MSTIEKYGKFLTSEGCFEITAEPPRKWRNIHYNQWDGEEYYAEATHIGDGLSRYRDARGNTVNVIGYDAKYLYLRDDETNTVFNPAGMPVATDVADRVIRIYPSQTEIASSCVGLRATQRIFVPRTECLEAWTLKIENQTDRPRRVSVFAYASFALTGNDHEGRGFWPDKYSELHKNLGGVLIINRAHKIPLEKKNGFLVALNHFHAANGCRDDFTRADYSLAAPKILWGWNCDNNAGYVWDTAAIVQCTLTIPARGAERVDFLAGPCIGAEEVKALRTRLTPAKLDELAAEQMAIERRRAEAFTVDTGEANRQRDALMNLFVKKQIYSYAMDKGGVRDNLQNANALVLFEPQMARANILKCLAVQKPDGSSLHSWWPFNRHQYSDKPAWMLQTIPWYVQETGDFTILDEPVPFFESAETGTVWDHLQRAYRWLSADLGKRGLCRQHFADWNDGLEPSEKTGERESVMVSQQLCAGLLETAALAERRNDTTSADECLRLHREMAERINRAAWDGAWFTRTICEDGYALGSSKNAEAKIFINTQSWAVLGRVADESRLRRCMASVDEFLTKPEGYPICDPACSTFDERIGRFTTVMPQDTVNGGCYNHAAGFKCVADCLLGRAEEAWETFIKVAPDGPHLPVSVSGAEPFSFINHYSRVPSGFGKGGYPWRTGTAAWFTVALLEYILGARRGYDGLIISPCLSKTVPHAKLRRQFRGATFDITLDNTAGRCVGTRRILVDGKLIAGNTLPLFTSGTHQVEVEI